MIAGNGVFQALKNENDIGEKVMQSLNLLLTSCLIDPKIFIVIQQLMMKTRIVKPLGMNQIFNKWTIFLQNCKVKKRLNLFF